MDARPTRIAQTAILAAVVAVAALAGTGAAAAGTVQAMDHVSVAAAASATATVTLPDDTTTVDVVLRCEPPAANCAVANIGALVAFPVIGATSLPGGLYSGPNGPSGAAACRLLDTD